MNLINQMKEKLKTIYAHIKDLVSTSQSLRLVAIIVCLGIALLSCYHVFGRLTKRGEAPTVEVKSGEITPAAIRPTVENVVKDEKVATTVSNKVVKEINTIKESNTEPVKQFTSNTSSDIIDEAVRSTKPDLVVKETDVKEHSGTNIYSVKVRTAAHGIGPYIKAKNEDGIRDFSAGLHYRNKRWVYRVGADMHGHPEASLGFELIQW